MDRKRAEAVIETSARRREEFLAMLSHELRNRLAAVLRQNPSAVPLEAERSRVTLAQA
jgi:signal transduction histidine kinase